MSAATGSRALLVPLTAEQIDALHEIAAKDGMSVQELLAAMAEAVIAADGTS